ncbi:hypothetical protein DPQ33_13245 [Oceanidesulfovibrio indonesiensis]|uniref:UPF0182 protein DPQ33_13245 n=1 Tax=Oceanidesulfovibrio indonesiensis TaxID=54767 RepID=A0A7M3MCT0_9BACT|nr:UPF0182 family protein [Oceanidesulfovibrio indonesiensis]TVM16279.1 hypothetical protein DPQ33_13245 [Oceanidesulfovibrio indonesiensis]
MYIAIIVIGLALALYLVHRGRTRGSRASIALGVGLGVAVAAFFMLLGLWGDALWFDSVGYSSRFWKAILTQILLFIVVGSIVGGALYLLLRPLTRGVRRTDERNRFARSGAAGLVLLSSGAMAAGKWDLFLRFLNAEPTGQADPALGLDVSFYLFTLPILDLVQDMLLVTIVIGLIATFLAALTGQSEGEAERVDHIDDPGEALTIILQRPFSLFSPVTVLGLLALAYGQVLNIFHLLYSTYGVVQGPGWTDMHVRLPGYVIMTVLLVLIALLIALPGMRRRIGGRLMPRAAPGPLSGNPVLPFAVVAVAVWALLLNLAPVAVQWLVVEPNEITYEEPYIRNSIEMTRRAFKLDTVEEQQFPHTGALTRQTVTENKSIFENVRLWDWRALEAVFKQFQEIRLYYEFADVDVDRYHLGDEYRQVMISPREMNVDNLPDQSNTFINRRFKYTHGYGAVVTPVSEFSENGLPEFLVKDLPPVTEEPALQLDTPAIYYGELTHYPAVVNSEETELDYPSGADNVYVHYDGTGGVPMEGLWRKFVFGWKHDGTRLFMSGYPREGTRIQFRRQIRDRVQTLAPFLDYDTDPYCVIANGKLYWIIDAYTSSGYYPYSESFRSGAAKDDPLADPEQILRTVRGERLTNNVNYVRNSVKVVVDAYNGDVDFFVFDPDDPIIKAWQGAFPNMFKPRDAMDDTLERHIRYPADLLLLQGLVFSKFHMTNPSVFYNQEDLWVRATEKYYGQVVPVAPYYIMWEPQGSTAAEYVLILPFTPKNRQVLIGWIAGMCDGENYGRLIAYKFPKEKRVLGPQQVETKIDQDSFLSGQLSLWDQRGSNVIRGNVLAIPVDETLIYVEPIYLQSETAAYPELRLVALMHEDTLSYAETFEEALQGLLGESPARQIEAAPGAAPGTRTMDELIGRAAEAFDRAMESMGQRSFQNAMRAFGELEETLSRLREMREADAENGGQTGQSDAAPEPQAPAE